MENKKNKYMCRCGQRVDRLTSFLKEGRRVTLCDKCAVESGIKNNPTWEAKDYESTQEKKAKNINKFKLN